MERPTIEIGPFASELLVLASNSYLAKFDARFEFGLPVLFCAYHSHLQPIFSKKFT